MVYDLKYVGPLVVEDPNWKKYVIKGDDWSSVKGPTKNLYILNV